jgi:hypothetical protein
MIVTTGLMVLRGEQARGFLNGIFSADGAHMVGATVQAFHVSQSIETTKHLARQRPLDTNFFTTAGAVGGGREQRFWFFHGVFSRLTRTQSLACQVIGMQRGNDIFPRSE